MWTILIVGGLLLITVIVIPCVVEERKERKRRKIFCEWDLEKGARWQMLGLIKEDREQTDAEWIIFRREMLRENLATLRRLQHEYEQAGGEFPPDSKY